MMYFGKVNGGAFGNRLRASVVASLLVPACVLGQSEPGANEAPAVEPPGLDVVTVTAQKFEQNAQKVPVALTTYDAEGLEMRQAFGLQDMGSLVPNFYVEENLSNPGTPKIYMRGIGQSNSAFSFDSPIGIYVDNVYYAKSVGSMVNFLDIERIEVLRGPQGTIYGRNSSIGAVRIVSKTPPLHEMDADAELTVGTHEQRNIRAALGMPLVEGTLGFRIAYNKRDNEGYQVNTVSGDRAGSDDSDAVRAQLLAQLSDDVSLTLRGDYLRDDSRPFVAMNFLNNELDSLQFQSNRSYSDGTVRSRLETFGASATFDWDFAESKLTSVTAWRGVDTINSFDTDGTVQQSFEVDRSDLDDRSFTQEVFVSSSAIGGVPVDWIAGAFFLHEITDYVWSLQIFAPPSVQDFHQEVDSLAGYLQGTWNAGDRLSLTAGARYTTEDKEFDVVSRNADGSPDFSFSDHSLSTRQWTWRAAVNYDFEAPVMLYASAATGFRSGGLNGNAQTLAEVTGGAFAPEDTLMYEAGIKSEFLSQRLRLNATYFYGEYDNLQQAVVLEDGTVSNQNNSAEVRGLELEISALPVEGLELSATLGTLDNEIKGSDTSLGLAPDLNWRLEALYSFPVGDLGVLSAGASHTWTDSVFQDAANTPILEVPSHGITNAHVALDTQDGHWRFTLAGENLGDEIYPVGGFFIAGGFISAVKWPTLPRRWSLTAQYRY